MKKYRISYDKYFTCKNDYIKYKNEEIDGIAIYFEYHIKDKKTGKEIFFTCEDEPYEQRLKITIATVFIVVIMIKIAILDLQ